MVTKIGETQGMGFFRAALEDRFPERNGKDADYSIGDFSASQDRKFADFFAGTASTCMLIEFNEYVHEIGQETRKPLRRKLCENLNDADAQLSSGSHFIAHRLKTPDIQVRIAPYIDVVCRDLGVGCPPLQPVNFSAMMISSVHFLTERRDRSTTSSFDTPGI